MLPNRVIVLIVEDEPDHVHILREMLQRAGYGVIQAFGVDDALRKIRTRRPDIVLTDLAMPKANGVQLIDAVKSNPETEDLPVIAVSAHAWTGLAQAARSAGCDGFISKPFTKDTLLKELDAQLRRRDGKKP